MKLSKLCLGTAQLGMNYGINNLEGKPSMEESRSIVKNAIDSDINVFDTAPGYGDSESVLGECLNDVDKDKIILISKIPPTDWSKSSEEILASVNNSLKNSLKNLRIKKMSIYLFHRSVDIEKENGLILEELKRLGKNGLIGKIGVSIYTPEEAEKAMHIKGIEVIQIPFNLVDKRLLENGFLKRAKKKKITILARSVFLQGLFFKKEIPNELKEFKPFQKEIIGICKKNRISVGDLALRYVLSIDWIDSILIGVEKIAQLKENVRIYKKEKLSKSVIEEINNIKDVPEKIINPSLWNK